MEYTKVKHKGILMIALTCREIQEQTIDTSMKPLSETNHSLKSP